MVLNTTSNALRHLSLQSLVPYYPDFDAYASYDDENLRPSVDHRHRDSIQLDFRLQDPVSAPSEVNTPLLQLHSVSTRNYILIGFKVIVDGQPVFIQTMCRCGPMAQITTLP